MAYMPAENVNPTAPVAGTSPRAPGGVAGSGPAESEPAAPPIPPRYWWLKRILLVGAISLSVLALLRWWWGCEADRRLMGQLAEYRAAGQPVLLEDFARPSVPDEQNAAVLYYQAHRTLVADLGEKVTLPDGTQIGLNVDELLAHPALIASQPDVAGTLLGANATTLALLREARARPQADWDIALRNATNALAGLGTPQCALAKLIYLAARSRHAAGDDHGAVELLRDGLSLGRDTCQMAPLLLPYLIRGSIDALGAHVIEDVSHELNLSDSAARESARRLIAELLDEDEFRDAWLRAVLGERALHLDELSARGLLGGSLGGRSPRLVDRVGNFPLAPAWKLAAVRLLRNDSATAEAGAVGHWPIACALLAGEPEVPQGTAWWSGALGALLQPAGETMVRMHYRLLALRRMAATALAIRLFEIDHRKRPAALVELVPTYLPAVPLDPFAADDHAIGYATSAASPVLYCVNFDTVDDGGMFGLREDGAVERDAKDMPFFLNGDRPRGRSAAATQTRSAPPTPWPATSTQAVDDQK